MRKYIISGLNRPHLTMTVLFWILLTSLFVQGLFVNGNIQAVPYYIHYSVMLVIVGAFGHRKDYLSPMFIVLWISIIMGFVKSYTVLSEGVDYHRDARDFLLIDNAVISKYLLEAMSIVLVFAAYCVTPKSLSMKLSQPEPHRSPPCSLAVFLLLALTLFVLYLYVAEAGGFINAITQRAVTREDRLVAQIGAQHLLVLNQSYLICVVWVLLDKDALKRPSFGLVLVSLLLIGYLVTGSRGGLLNKCMVFALTATIVKGRFNFSKILLLALPAIVLVGYQSSNRFVSAEVLQSMGARQVISSALGGVRETLEEASRRGSHEDSSVGVYLTVPQSLDYQFGQTYKSIPFVFIPSVLLPFEKPNAAGAHYVSELTGRTDTAWPIGAIAEAYWNFSYLGVVLISIVTGVVYRFTYNTALRNDFSPLATLLYLAVVFRFSVGSDALYAFFQMGVLSLLIYAFFRFVGRFRVLSTGRVSLSTL